MRWTTAAAWGLGAITPALIAVAMLLDPAHRIPALDELAIGLQALVGTLLAWRRPRNPIGWIFVVTAIPLEFSYYQGGVAKEFVSILFPTAPTTALAIDRIAGGLGACATNIAVALPLLLFPNGQLASRRWLPIAILQSAIAAFAFFWEGFARPTLPPLPPFAGAEYANPLAISALHDVYVPGVVVGELATVLLLLAIATGVFRRYRRSRGDERQQFRCLALGAGLMILGIAATIGVQVILGTSGAVQPPTWVVEVLMPIVLSLVVAGIPVAMGVAIFRYRLYDIDALINRTVVYGATSAAIAVTFFAGLVALQGVLHALTSGTELAVAASTLVSFALFQPIRRRIQDAVDRRFNRAHYDASRTLDSFADDLRDQVDLDSVRSGLLGAVRETMEPAYASLWLRERR
jgi:hypothetical protein